MKINSRNPLIPLRPLGILAAWAVLSIGPTIAQTTISSAEIDLYHSAFVVDGTLDVDNPPPESTFGVDMWSGSASSSGTGSFTSTGNYTQLQVEMESPPRPWRWNLQFPS